ncbi:MAG: type II toxin-antitoxin system VapB family antitoxin [Candidatus Eremiobacterota bacterium]
MRTTIDIDKDLLEEAMKMSTVNTKKALIELSLKLFIKQKRKESLKAKLGNFDLNLDSDSLEEMRKDD